jgi:tetratricopeptide (TPR) repeat protein
LRQAVAAEPDWALAHVALCAAYSRLDRVDDALREAAHAERLEPTWWGGAAAAGSANAYAGKLEAAIEDYRRALAVAPDHPLLTADLALVYHASHIDAEAERLAKRALELDEALVSPRILLAERALERGDGQAALSEASRALAVLPKSVPARLAQADALLVLGREPEARDAYARALAVWKEAGGGGPFDERMQATERALASGALPSRTPTATAEPSSAPVASVPTRAPVRSPVPAAKKPAASPAPPGDRSSNDGRRGLDMGL